jgi:predicted SprT family Zn-dependent metalloprotease
MLKLPPHSHYSASHQMDQTVVIQLARDLMRKHKLNGWSFGFNQAKRNLGVCKYEQKCIELSVHFVMANDKAAVRDTILHEIAHAMAGREAGHGSKWKSICREIGAKPERCDTEAAMPRGQWQAVCPGCQREHHRHRRPLRDRRYACRRCGPKIGTLKFSPPES